MDISVITEYASPSIRYTVQLITSTNKIRDGGGEREKGKTFFSPRLYIYLLKNAVRRKRDRERVVGYVYKNGAERLSL